MKKLEGVTDYEIDKAFSHWEIPEFPLDIGATPSLPQDMSDLERARHQLTKMLTPAIFADNTAELEQAVSKYRLAILTNYIELW